MHDFVSAAIIRTKNHNANYKIVLIVAMIFLAQIIEVCSVPVSFHTMETEFPGSTYFDSESDSESMIS